jgi:hypothetical protein
MQKIKIEENISEKMKKEKMFRKKINKIVRKK